MKKNIFKIIITSIFTILLFANISINKEKINDVKLQNILALTEAYGQQGVTCYEIIHNCWFWNCFTVPLCISCGPVSADNWFQSNICFIPEHQP